ncbi:MAG: mercury(II) reductase [Vulcanimicrobiaceae bacterium]
MSAVADALHERLGTSVATDPATAPDVAVIGAGSAGFAAAIRASELGAAVTLIGHGPIGGTCVNIGCVPSKTLIRAVETVHQARAASRFAGVVAQARIDDWRAVVAQKDELVAQLQGAKYRDVLAQYDGIRSIDGPARFTSDGLVVGDETLTPQRTIIATGASPAVPSIPGLAGLPYLTSTTALQLSDLPESLVVIGGGVIGCELGQMFARAGVRVTLVCRTRLLPGGEPEISAALAEYLRAEGVDVRTGVAYESARPAPSGVEFVVRDADGHRATLSAQRVLVATGRTPNTAGLDLELGGIALSERGGIAIDDRMRTTRPGTYAVGDVTGTDMYVYMAAYGGKIAAENALEGDRRRYDSSAMPDVTFTDPQVATVGLTEARARAAGRDVDAVVLPLAAVPRALAARDTRGLIKLVAERESGRLLGAHVLAPEGGDTIQTAVLAIKHGLTVADLADALFPYLTTVEGLKLAALAFTKDVSKLSCCAG